MAAFFRNHGPAETVEGHLNQRADHLGVGDLLDDEAARHVKRTLQQRIFFATAGEGERQHRRQNEGVLHGCVLSAYQAAR